MANNKTNGIKPAIAPSGDYVYPLVMTNIAVENHQIIIKSSLNPIKSSLNPIKSSFSYGFLRKSPQTNPGSPPTTALSTAPFQLLRSEKGWRR